MGKNHSKLPIEDKNLIHLKVKQTLTSLTKAINGYHLNGSGLHLNRKGDAALARNFINHIKNKPNFLNESTESGRIDIDQDKIPAGNGSSPIPENETLKT